MKEWTPTFPNELPLWKFEFQWTFKFLEGNCRNQNSLDWKVSYTIENLQSMGFQSYGSPNFGNFRNFRTSNLVVPAQNDIWVLAPWPCTKNTIRGKVVASPKPGPWWILWICVCPRLVCWCTPNSLLDSNVSPNWKQHKSKESKHDPCLVALWGVGGMLELQDGIRNSNKHQLLTHACTKPHKVVSA